ncbi:carbon storage regulator [Shewanella colwelliana]|uniref:carbon storage regulator n=1 Tax=Shewanella colwelliana TaxID=23 RepID=UPI00373620A6
MLTLTRLEGESLYLDNIYDADGNEIPPIVVKRVDKNRIGIEADYSVRILRSEIVERIKIDEMNARYRDGVYLAEKEE